MYVNYESNKINFANVVNPSDMVEYLPINYKTTCNVRIESVRLSSAYVVVEPNRDGMGKGWDTLCEDLIWAWLDEYEDMLFCEECHEYWRVEFQSEREVEEYFSSL